MALITLDGGQSESAINGQSVDYFVQKAIIDCPGAPETLVESKLQDVLRAFYTDSTAWRQFCGPFKVVQGRQEVQLNPVDQYTQLQYVLGAYLYPSVAGGNAKQYLKASPRLFVGADTGTPAAFFMLTPDTMQMFPTPNETLGQVLYVYGVCTPLINTPRLPNISTTHHFDAIMAGLLSRLYAMPNKPWSSKESSKDYDRFYKQCLSRFRDEANRAYSSAEAPFRFPTFANNGSQGMGGVYSAR